MLKRLNESSEIEVQDFGPISKAKVELRPLTVFVGPSNAGKSYLAILIYALHRMFGVDSRPVLGNFGRTSLLSLTSFNDMVEQNFDAILDFARSFESEVNDGGKIVLPKTISDLLCSAYSENDGTFEHEILRCFGLSEVSKLVRKGKAKESHIFLRKRFPDLKTSVEYKAVLGQDTKLAAKIPVGVPIHGQVDETTGGNTSLHERLSYLVSEVDHPSNEESRLFYGSEILRTIFSIALPNLVGPLHMPAFYLPADRTGVMHTHDVVVRALIKDASTAGVLTAPMLSGVLADFLENLIGFASNHRGSGNSDDYGSGIERSILQGSIHVNNMASLSYPQFTYQPKGWKDDLALANASSMVSELAPVVLYLRHMVKPDNVLIIEEPESHLHPVLQVEFTREIAKLVQAGIRIIITTHSEWLTEELANIVQRYRVTKFDRGEPGRREPGKQDVSLHPHQVGVWLFENQKSPKGSTVREIKLDESGMFDVGYDDIAIALQNEWAEITSRLGAES